MANGCTKRSRGRATCATRKVIGHHASRATNAGAGATVRSRTSGPSDAKVEVLAVAPAARARAAAPQLDRRGKQAWAWVSLKPRTRLTRRSSCRSRSTGLSFRSRTSGRQGRMCPWRANALMLSSPNASKSSGARCGPCRVPKVSKATTRSRRASWRPSCLNRGKENRLTTGRRGPRPIWPARKNTGEAPG